MNDSQIDEAEQRIGLYRDALVDRNAALVEALNRLMVVGSAATGHPMCDFDTMHGYIEEIMGRPVWTHEMGAGPTADKIQELAQPDFVEAITAAQVALAAAQKAAS